MELVSSGAASVAASEGADRRPPGSARPGGGPAVPPLAVSGLVVAKADLVAALRLFVPQLVDVAALDDGRFVLGLRHGS